MHSSKVYTKLQERLGLNDHLALLNVMLTKIATNLRTYGKAEELVHATLNLFSVGGVQRACGGAAAGMVAWRDQLRAWPVARLHVWLLLVWGRQTLCSC
jgi:hypothetical protein